MARDSTEQTQARTQKWLVRADDTTVRREIILRKRVFEREFARDNTQRASRSDENWICKLSGSRNKPVPTDLPGRAKNENKRSDEIAATRNGERDREQKKGRASVRSCGHSLPVRLALLLLERGREGGREGMNNGR